VRRRDENETILWATNETGLIVGVSAASEWLCRFLPRVDWLQEGIWISQYRVLARSGLLFCLANWLFFFFCVVFLLLLLLFCFVVVVDVVVFVVVWYVGADLRYLVLSHTPAHTARPRIRASMSRDVPFHSPAGYLSRLPVEGCLRLSRHGCLVLRRGGLLALLASCMYGIRQSHSCQQLIYIENWFENKLD